MIIKYWPLILGGILASVAWGANHQKIATLEQAMIQQQEQGKELSYIKATQSALNERTQIIMDMLTEQKAHLLNISGRMPK